MKKDEKQSEYQAVFDEFQRLKTIYPFDCKTDIIKRMLGENANKAGINRIDHILTRVFGIKGDRFVIQERLETAVFEMWDKLQPETQGNVRQTARLISGSLNVDCRRVLSMLYRNGYFGNCKKNTTPKPKKQGVTPAAVRYQSEVEKWNNLFSQGDMMKFSPAWVGKIQAA